jgi:hypothetical protein
VLLDDQPCGKVLGSYRYWLRFEGRGAPDQNKMYSLAPDVRTRVGKLGRAGWVTWPAASTICPCLFYERVKASRGMLAIKRRKELIRNDTMIGE